jgi:Fe-S cluster assembly protein SufB
MRTNLNPKTTMPTENTNPDTLSETATSAVAAAAEFPQEEAPDAATADAIRIDRERGNFSYAEDYAFDAGEGLNAGVLDYISEIKKEPRWVREFRHAALREFESKPLPLHWAAPAIAEVDFSKIRYYLAKGKRSSKSWEDVPDDVKRTFERLGIPERERKFLAGVEAQFDSESAYSRMKDELGKQGVIFVGPDEGLTKYPEVFRKFFGTVVPPADNKFAALNSAVFSGGSFIYVPPGVKVAQPLQAYFRINAERFGQFERTLIIADKGAELTYMEGCTAPKFDTATLHSAVVELVALDGAKIQYITVQNWATNVFNLVTKRGVAGAGAQIRWIDCNIGSRLTMKYPAVVLNGAGASGEVISIALAGDGQIQDTGAKMIHNAPRTTSNIISKSISVGSGLASYRGRVHIPKKFTGCRNNTECDALLINSNSRTDTYPAITVSGARNSTQHEASVSKVSAEQIFYMMQRGLSEAEAMSLTVNGFINDLVKEFPMEYSAELKRLVELEMEGSVG